MRLFSKSRLKDLVLYSPQHVARLEAAGKFPKRVQLGQCRVGWSRKYWIGSKSGSIAEIYPPTTPDKGGSPGVQTGALRLPEAAR